MLSDWLIKLAYTPGTDPMLCYACVKGLDVSCIIEIQLRGTDPMLCYACVKPSMLVLMLE